MTDEPIAEPREKQDRAPGYQAIALHAAAALSDGDRHPKTLHRLRTYLRRLQAYLELVGETGNADRIARCVSRLSRLRTLQVFEGYLKDSQAPKRDRQRVKARIRKTQATLDRKQVYGKITRVVEHYALPPTPASADWMAHRMKAVRNRHADRLREMFARAEADPRRKILHGLRLMIKSVRYQEEWALGRPYARPDLVAWLKRAQTVLGDYEDHAQFRKLAVKLDLASQTAIERDWRRARTKARGLPRRLHGRIATLTRRHLKLVQPALGRRG